VQVVFDISCLEVPCDQGSVVPACVDQLVVSVVCNTHDVIAMARVEVRYLILLPSLTFLGQVLDPYDLFFLLICPDVDLLVPTDCNDVSHLFRVFRFEGTCHAGYLFINMMAIFV
jgi:hypothetical protein